MSVDAYYRTLVARAEQALDAFAINSDQITDFTVVHNYGSEFETLISAIEDRPEAKVFRLALREFYYGLYAAASGSYRHAHISLRLFLELFLAGVYFSAYEIKLQSWILGLENSDVNWSSVNDIENGIFSVSFLKAFHSDLATSGKQYRAIATKTYRECSEFVHGNLHTHALESVPLSYDSMLLAAWIERATAVRICIHFAFAGRYLRLLNSEQALKIENIMLDNFGHLSAVRARYA